MQRYSSSLYKISKMRLVRKLSAQSRAFPPKKGSISTPKKFQLSRDNHDHRANIENHTSTKIPAPTIASPSNKKRNFHLSSDSTVAELHPLSRSRVRLGVANAASLRPRARARRGGCPRSGLDRSTKWNSARRQKDAAHSKLESCVSLEMAYSLVQAPPPPPRSASPSASSLSHPNPPRDMYDQLRIHSFLTYIHSRTRSLPLPPPPHKKNPLGRKRYLNRRHDHQKHRASAAEYAGTQLCRFGSCDEDVGAAAAAWAGGMGRWDGSVGWEMGEGEVIVGARWWCLISVVEGERRGVGAMDWGGGVWRL